MKIYHLKSFSLYILTLLFASSLWGQALRNLSYSQRPGTKLIDIQYDLVLASGSAAKIDFFFSFDNGKTYPIPCVSLSGDVGSYVVAGTKKKAVWNVGRDWDQKYTDQGRIKVRSSIAEKMEAIEFAVASIPFRASNIQESPSWFVGEFYSDPFGDGRINGVPLSPPTKFLADQYEVTNHQWNQVVDWAKNKGYDLQSVSYMPGEENLPRTNVAMKEVVKWLNARTEMEGKTPVFYVDPIEPAFDWNGDGRISIGPDFWLRPEEEMEIGSPSFDWSIIANHDQSQRQEWIQQGWIDFDPNHDRNWVPGEPFVDRNRNGKFEPVEYEDFNGNGKRDLGQTIVCRTGDISAWFQNYIPANAGSLDLMLGWHLGMHVKESANGYRLPLGHQWGWGQDSFRYLAMGGRTEQGSYQTWEDRTQPGYWDPITFEWKYPMQTGIRYVEEWPWGAQSPENMPDISEYAVTPYGANPASGIQPVGGRKPNGYGLHDMIGNVAELTMDWYVNPDPSMGMMPGMDPHQCNAVGGSFSNLPMQHDPQHDPFMSQNNNPLSPRSVMSLGQYLPATGSPEVGFRAIRIEF
jgi:formylglycine-generating enzyme required for sulfatase activity